MKIKLQSLWNLARISEQIALRNEDSPLAQLMATRLTPLRRFTVNKQAQAIQNEMASLEAVRVEALREFGTEEIMPDGQTILRVDLATESGKAFADKIQPLLDSEVEIPGEPFSLTELGDTLISGDALEALSFLFTEYVD